MTWKIVPLPDVEKRLNQFKKKWPHELRNVFDNLDSLVKALNAGSQPEQLKQFGFVQSEPFGILAINQKGPGKGSKLKPFRLYTFADTDDKTLYLMTLGDKDTQADDIKDSKYFVQGLTQRTKPNAGIEAKDG